MKKTTLALGALTLSLGLALSPFSTTAAEASSATTTQQMPSLAPMFEKVMPSIISASVRGSTTVNTPRMPCNFWQLFGDGSLFCQEDSPFQSSPFCQGGQSGNGDNQQQKFTALGSGVIIGADKGYVVTNNHIVDDATVIKIQLNDGRKLDAKMVGRGPCSDIALIQIQNPRDLTAIKIADSDTLHVGDYTVAIGNPFGLGETVTFGVISALEHSDLNAENYENFIQTDAAINRGNSGDTLVNLNGELIGINIAILAPDGGNIDIGFVIPSNMVRNLALQVMKYGQVKRDELGIMGTGLNSELAKAIKASAQRGAFISQARPGSPATKADIKAGDVTTSLNDRPISNFTALRAQVGTIPMGSKLTLGLLRDGKQVNMNLGLQQNNRDQVDSNSIFSGIEGAKMNNKGKDQDVVVSNVKTGTPAAQIGLEKGDMIIGANQQAVKNIAGLCKVLDSEPSMLALNIQHGDSSIYLSMQ